MLPRTCGRQHSNVSKLASIPQRTSTMLPLQLLRNIRGRRWCCGGGGCECALGGAVMLMPPFGGWLCVGAVAWWCVGAVAWWCVGAVAWWCVGAVAWWWNCVKMLGMLSSPHSCVRRRRYLCPCRWWKWKNDTSMSTRMTHVSATYGTHSSDTGIPVVVITVW